MSMKETQVFTFHLYISESSACLKSSQEHGKKGPALLCQGKRWRRPTTPFQVSIVLRHVKENFKVLVFLCEGT